MTVALALVLSIAGVPTSTASASASTSTSAGVVMGLDELEEETPAPKKAESAPQGSAEDRATVVEEVEVSERRVAEAARPDTTLRITGKQLRERGVTNLSQALDLVPEAVIKPAGRGGSQVTLRGARKGGVLILLDGIPISDPFFGNFDVTSIPTTDIAEIRLSMTPASPLDGPGGNGGVVEVITRAASGPANLRANVQASSAPSGDASITGRAPISSGFSARVSAGGTMGFRDLPVTLPSNASANISEDIRSGAAGLRLEQRSDAARLAADFGFSRRRFYVPPGEDAGNDVLFVKREDLFRGVLSAETQSGRATYSARAYTLVLDRDQNSYRDASLSALAGDDHVFAHRSGGALQLDYALASDLRLSLVTHLMVEGGHESSTTYFETMPPFASTDGGVAPVLQPAAGVFYFVTRWLQVDVSAGVAIPIGYDASPWPEGKITATVTPTSAVQLRLTGVRKGRVPTIRDRYEPNTGNSAIAPEMGNSLEGSVLYKPWRWASLEVAGYYRLTEGLIRLNDARTQLANVGDVTVAGVEARAEVTPLRFASAGVAYAYANATWAQPGNPLDFFPNHIFQAWLALRAENTAGLWTRARYTGDRTDSGNTLPAYTTLDAAIWAKLDRFRATVRAENLLDHQYEMRSGVPGYGRTIFVGIEGELD